MVEDPLGAWASEGGRAAHESEGAIDIEAAYEALLEDEPGDLEDLPLLVNL